MVTPQTPARSRGVDGSARIVALIPAYQAAHLVGPVIAEARKHLPVLVVDDGSIDETARVAEAAGARVVRQTPNQGKGAALRNGFRNALADGCDAVITLDADGQHDPAEIPAFLAEYARTGAELIIGARNFSEMPAVRRLSNTLGRRAFSWAMGEEIRDNQSGYRLIHRRLIDATLESGESGFEFEVEMIATCIERGYSLGWVPIRTIYEGAGSHIRPLQHLMSFARVVWQTRRRMKRRRPS